MKKHILFIVLLFPNLILGQSTNPIETTLSIDVVPYFAEKADTLALFYKNLLQVKQTFQLQDYREDSICLQISNPSSFSFLNNIYFQKIMIEAEINNTKIPVSFVFKTDGIHLATPSSNCKIVLNYFYQPDYILSSTEQDCMAIGMYQQSWFSWYFSMPNMRIINANFTIPDNIYFFVNVPKNKLEKTIELSCEAIPEYGISFFLVEKRYYERFKVNLLTNEAGLYLYKDIITTKDSTSYDTYYVPSARITPVLKEQYTKNVTKAIRQSELLFNKHINVDVIDGMLTMSQNENNIGWGTGFPVSNNYGFIIIDTIFWKKHLMTHEIIHLYNTILPERKDTSFYFFHESMTEYLSILFEYNNPEHRDSIFENKILEYNSRPQKHTNIFQINQNIITLNQEGTYGVIYLKAPYLIHSFAKNIGEEKFIELLTAFYKSICDRKNITFLDMENYLKQYGVSEQQWDWFVEKLIN